MIEKITIKDVASYDEAGVEILDLTKVNFFFGNNGSGKSTIASYLFSESLEETSPDKSAQFNLCSSEGYCRENHNILVFDEGFIQRNFVLKNTQEGIFSLNEENADLDNKIEREKGIQDKHENYRDQTLIKRRQFIEDFRESQNTNLFEYCFRKRDSLKTFYKHDIEHGKSKQKHLDKVCKILKTQPIQLVTIKSLSERYNKIYDKELKYIDQNISLEGYGKITGLEKKINEVLNEVIVGNEDVDIAEMITRLGINKWVREGRSFVSDNTTRCPFCQEETISVELLNKFEDYFDETYKQKIHGIENLKNEYGSVTSRYLNNISSIKEKYNVGQTVSTLELSLRNLFNSNIRIIEEKISESNVKKEITSLSTLKEEIVSVTKAIENNNRDFSQLDSIKSDFDRNIWLYFANECRKEIDNHKAILNRLDSLVPMLESLERSTNEEIIKSKSKIKEWREQTLNTKEAVDKINIILNNSGFEGFSIAVSEETENNITRYCLKRGFDSGIGVFNSLSEGEKNFIAFLYFYQLCLGTNLLENGGKKKIIVIDDPVSSLDSQALFIVSTLIHNLIRWKGDEPKRDKKEFYDNNILQVFILTHNLYFYKEVSFDKRPICTKRMHYKVAKVNSKSSVSGSEKRTITDDYTLLWSALQEVNNNMPVNTTQNVVIGNIMRRILESYINFIGKKGDSWKTLYKENKHDPKYYIKCAFISNINDESHKVSIFDDIYYQKIANENPQVLFEVFKEIFISIGEDHYNMMMGVEEDLLHDEMDSPL